MLTINTPANYRSVGVIRCAMWPVKCHLFHSDLYRNIRITVKFSVLMIRMMVSPGFLWQWMHGTLLLYSDKCETGQGDRCCLTRGGGSASYFWVELLTHWSPALIPAPEEPLTNWLTNPSPQYLIDSLNSVYILSPPAPPDFPLLNVASTSSSCSLSTAGGNQEPEPQWIRGTFQEVCHPGPASLRCLSSRQLDL